MLERRLCTALRARHFRRHTGFLHSKRAFAIPITYLILFASLVALISLTYSFAIVKINARTNGLKTSVAKQNMQILDDSIHSIAWSFGASKAVYMDDCGGVFKTAANAKRLSLTLTDERTINSIAFNSSIGEAFYELVQSELGDYGLYIRGDERPIINKTSFSMTQLYVAGGNSTQSLVLCYRPLATVAVIGTNSGKPINLIRVNVMNFNSSSNLALSEKFYLKVTSVGVTVVSSRYEFNNTVASLALKATLDGSSSTVWLPVSSSAQGAVVNLEVVICNVRLQRAEM